MSNVSLEKNKSQDRKIYKLEYRVGKCEQNIKELKNV